MIEYLFFVIGLFLLIKGADFLIEGASDMASRLGISKLIIGLTVVAIGTSAPELFVNIIVAIKGESDIAVGNIIGSNIANILLILGIMLFASNIKIEKEALKKEIPYSFLITLLLLFFALTTVTKGHNNSLSLIEGLILMGFFVLYINRMYKLSKKKEIKHKIKFENKKPFITIANLILGILGLYMGGELVVNSSIFIATNLGVSEYVISLTIIAIGTSLPELVTGIVSVVKKQAEMGVGNIIGSNIFNMLWVLGLTAVIRETTFPAYASFDIIFLLIATNLLFLFAISQNENKLKKIHGASFLIIYAAYVLFLFLR